MQKVSPQPSPHPSPVSAPQPSPTIKRKNNRSNEANDTSPSKKMAMEIFCLSLQTEKPQDKNSKNISKIKELLEDYLIIDKKLAALGSIPKTERSSPRAGRSSPKPNSPAAVLNLEKNELFIQLVENIRDKVMGSGINLNIFLDTFMYYKATLKLCFAAVSFSQALTFLSIQGKNLSNKTIDFLCENKNLKDAWEQLELENSLLKLGMQYYSLNLIANKTKRTRIIFTTKKDTNLGFTYLKKWIELFGSSIPQEILCDQLKKAGIKGIISDLNKQKDIILDLTALEIAWYHVMNNGKHPNDHVVFVTEMQGLQEALVKSTANSTLVINGHGGGNTISLGEEVLKGTKDLDQRVCYLASIASSNITHVVLASCATGMLNKDIATKKSTQMAPVLFKYAFSKNGTSTSKNGASTSFKNRQKMYVTQGAEVEKMFKKINEEKQLPFAARLAAGILNRKDQDIKRGTAFTFSPSLLITDIPPRSGTIGVPMAFGDNRKEWPDSVDAWDLDGRLSDADFFQIAYKSVTLYNNPSNDKALVVNGNNLTWKAQ
jgi:hypothetical protein